MNRAVRALRDGKENTPDALEQKLALRTNTALYKTAPASISAMRMASRVKGECYLHERTYFTNRVSVNAPAPAPTTPFAPLRRSASSARSTSRGARLPPLRPLPPGSSGEGGASGGTRSDGRAWRRLPHTSWWAAALEASKRRPHTPHGTRPPGPLPLPRPTEASAVPRAGGVAWHHPLRPSVLSPLLDDEARKRICPLPGP